MSSRAKPLNTEPQPEQVTLVFTDIVDSTAIKPRVGGDLVYFKKLLQPHNARLRQYIERYSGHEVKTIGDSFMINFDKATEAVSFTVALQQHFEREPLVEKGVTLAIRIGIHTGEALAYIDEISGRLDYSGNTVDCAARVESLAIGGQVLISEDTYWDVRRMQDVRFHDWGEYPLKGFTQRPVIWEVLWGKKQPQRPSGSYWLPSQQLSKFVGRKRELLELQQLIRDHRLVTLLGVGGIGKTRLALEVAFRLSEEIQGGIIPVKLADISKPISETDKPDLLIPAIVSMLAHVLELKCESGNERNAVKGFLKARPFLLILDNCETVLPATGFFEELLGECPKLRLLATSQHPLGIDGEQKFKVEPMDIPSLTIRHPSLDNFDSFLLFDDRASHQKTDWKQDADLSIAADMLRLTDGIPLAIELVASWVGYRPLAMLRKSLQAHHEQYLHRAELSTYSIHDSDRRRHISMQACLDWSFHLLSIDEQTLFKRLSVFIGGFFPEAVEPVCDMPNTQPLLDALYRHSLVQWHAISGKQRYQMLGIVRDYAERKLGHEKNTFWHRSATFFRDMVRHCEGVIDHSRTRSKTSEPESKTPNPPTTESNRNRVKDTIQSLQNEHVNLITTIEWAYKNKHPEFVWELTSRLASYFYIRSHWSDWERCCKMALELARCQSDRERIAIALGNLGRVYDNQSRYEDAARCYEEGLDLLKTTGDSNLAPIVMNLGLVRFNQGKWDVALNAFEEALNSYRQMPDPIGEGSALNNIGLIYLSRGEFEKAITVVEQSLEVRRIADDLWGQSQSLGTLRDIHLKMRNWEKAKFYHDLELPICREIGDRHAEAGALLNWGVIQSEQQNWSEAIRYYTEALEIFREIGNLHGQAHVINCWGNVHVNQGNWTEGKNCYEESVRIYQMVGDKYNEGKTLSNLGNLYAHRCKYNDAISCYQKDIEICEELGDRPGLAHTLVKLGVVYASQSLWEKAQGVFNQALSISRETKDRIGEAMALSAMGEVYLRAGVLSDAKTIYESALTIYRDVNDRIAQAQTLGKLGAICVGKRDPAKAQDYYHDALKIIREVSDPLSEAAILDELCSLYRMQGRISEAIECHQASLQIFQKLNCPQDEAMVLSNLGMTYASQKSWEQATVHLEKSAQIFGNLKDPNEIVPLRALAFIYFRQIKWRKAFGCIRRANRILKRFAEADRH